MSDDKPVSELLDDFQRRGRYGLERRELPRALLDPSAPRTGSASTNRWRIIENTKPEADL